MKKPKNMLRKATQEQRDNLIKLIIQDKYEEANVIANFLGYEGITSKFFEDLVEVEMMTEQVIMAIKVYFKDVEVKA